jgi:hypothetical protein
MGYTISFYTDSETEKRLDALLAEEAVERMNNVSRSQFLTSLINRRWKESHPGNGHTPASEEVQVHINEAAK